MTPFSAPSMQNLPCESTVTFFSSGVLSSPAVDMVTTSLTVYSEHVSESSTVGFRQRLAPLRPSTLRPDPMVCPTTAVFVFWTVRWLAQAPESVPRRRRRDASACTTTVFVTDDFWKVAEAFVQLAPAYSVSPS